MFFVCCTNLFSLLYNNLTVNEMGFEMVEVGKTYIGCHGHKATVTAIVANKVYYKDEFDIHYNKALDLFETIYIKRGKPAE